MARMFIPKIANKFLLFLLSSGSLVVIAVIDWFTGYEISFSVFYLLPLAFFALNYSQGNGLIVANAFIAAVLWLAADLNHNRAYSHIIIPYWNGFVRFVIFFSVSYLISELKTRNEQYRDANRRLTYLNEEKNKFLGIAAHDLRNPIGAIRSLSEVLLSDTKKSEIQRDHDKIFSMINKASTHSLEIIRNILDISSIESGKISPDIQQRNYIDTVRHCIEMNNLIAAKKDITISFTKDEEECVLSYDRHYIEEALDNLVGNAVKYSHPGTEITVKVTASESEVLTEVIDEGVGIDPAEIDHLFLPFQKTSSRPTSGETSTGLGLAIVKKIIGVHHGNVGVRANPEKGSTFFFSLPFHQPNTN